MKKLLSLLSVVSLGTCASSATVSCGGSSETSLKITGATSGSNLETSLETDFHNSDSSDVANTIISDISNGTIVINGYEFLINSDGTPDVKFFSNSNIKNVVLEADATIHVSVTTKEKIGTVAAGTYNGNFIVGKTSLSTIEKLSLPIGDNVYTSVRTQLGSLVGVSADAIHNDGVGIAIWSDGTLLNQETTAMAGKDYTIKLVAGDSMFFSGTEKDINVTIGKINLDTITKFQLAAGDDIYNDVRTELGKLVGVSADDIKNNSVVIAIYNDKGGLKDGATVVSGETYTVKLIANNSQYFTGDENDVKVSMPKIDLGTVASGDLEINTGVNIYNEVREELGSLVGVSADDIKNDGVGIAIWQEGGTEPLAQDTVAGAGQTYIVKLVAGTSSYFTGDEKDITVVAMHKIDLSDITNLNFMNGESVYDQVRTQLGALIHVSADDIKNDGVGIGIYQGTNSEPLAQDAIAVAGQTYTVKLVTGTSNYFTGDEKDITVSVDKMNLENVSTFTLTEGQSVYDQVRTELGKLVGVSASDIQNDGVGIGIYQGTNSEPLAQDAIAVAGQEYTVKLVAGDSMFFNGTEKDVMVSVDKMNLKNVSTFTLTEGQPVYDQVRTQLGALIGVSASDINSDGVGIAIWQEGGTEPLAQNAEATKGTKYIIKLVAGTSSYFSGNEKDITVVSD